MRIVAKQKPLQRPAGLNVSPMKEYLRFGNTNDKTNADAKALHAVNQMLQALRIVREKNNIISIAQERPPTARPQQ